MYRNHLEIFCEAGEISQECTILAEDLDSAPAPTLGSSQLLVTAASYRNPMPSSGIHEHLHVHGTHVCRHTHRVGGT